MPADRPKQIGRYKIEAEIGRGGYGRVYRALDPTVGRPVAIKILTEINAETQSRFRNEATVAGNLRHNNIVTIYEYGSYEGFPFLAMEYLEGEDLHRAIARGRSLNLLEKCNIMSQVADGLYYAHENGVVHRDMKPGNIMVLGDGSVKIMDFGIARVTRTPDVTRLTQQGFLIGTLSYMSPEQLTGADSDARCDIFAYGVIFYELIAGRHPFEASNAQNLMYRLSFDDPAPIRDFAPGAPEELERVIFKAIHKDREQRYQSLQEIRFDTEPIRLELQKRRASELLAQARGLTGEKRFEPAQKALQEALSLEPANTAARALWDTVQRQIQQLMLQPRIEALLSAGERHLAERRFEDAAKAFDSALQLDRENANIRERLKEAQSQVEHAKKAAELLADARREFEQKNLTAAYRILAEALRHDPKHPDAAEFLQTVQTHVERRQAEQKIEEAIRKAQGLLLIPAHDEALAALGECDPESPKIREWLERVRAEKVAHEKKQRLQREITAATDLLRAGQLNDAMKCLQPLETAFPENQEVSRLLAYAQKEQAASVRSQTVASAAAEARTRTHAEDFDGALAVLERALNEYPGESELVRLLAGAMAAKSAWQREQAIQAALGRCDSLRAGRRFAEAAETAKSCLAKHGAEPRLNGAFERIEKEWAQHRRDDAVKEICGAAESLLAQTQPEAAAEMLKDALAKYAGEATLRKLLRRAQEQALAREKARATERAAAIAKRVQDVRARAGAGDFDGALTLAEEGLRTWPDAAALQELRRAITAERKLHAKRARAVRELEEIGLAARGLSSASAATELLSLAERIAAEHLQDGEIQALTAEPIGMLSDIGRVRTQLKEGSLEAALQICTRRLARHPGHAVFSELQRECEQRRKLAWLEDVRRRAASEADLRERCRILERGLQQYPDEPAFADELRFTRNKLALIDSIVEQARAHETLGRWDLALEKWKSLLTVYGDYPGLQTEMERVARAGERALLEAVEREAQQIEQALGVGELGTAAELLRQAQTEYPTAERLRMLARRIDEIAAKRKRARALLAQAQTEGDHGRYDECRRLSRQAFQAEESDTAFRKSVLEKLAGYAQAALSVDWRQAQALVSEATALQPGFAVPSSVSQGIAEKESETETRVQATKPVPARQRQRLPMRGLIAGGAAAALLTGGVVAMHSRRPHVKPPSAGPAVSARGGETSREAPAISPPSAPSPAVASAPPEGAPAPTHAAAPARLEIAGSVAGAQVMLDGQPLGDIDRNGSLQRDVRPGAHTIEISKEDYAPLRLGVEFRSGKALKLAGPKVAMMKLPKPAIAPAATPAPVVPPPATPSPDPRQIEAQEWAQIANSSNADDFDAFLRNHPTGAHAEQARGRASDLRQKARAHAAQQQDQAAWEKTAQNNREQLQDYLSRFADGVHVQEARARLADLERQAADAAAAQRAREQVIGVLNEFEAAYNRKDLPALQKLWSGLPAATYRNQFRDSKDLKFQLQPVRQPELKGDAAAVVCTRTLSYRAQSGGTFNHSERVRVSLSREASGWVIRGIVLE